MDPNPGHEGPRTLTPLPQRSSHFGEFRLICLAQLNGTGKDRDVGNSVDHLLCQLLARRSGLWMPEARY